MKTALALALLSTLVAPGCGPRSAPTEAPNGTIEPVDGVKPAAPQPGGDEPPLPGSGDSEASDGKAPMPPEDCEKVGTVVGDPGDGRTRSPDFVCPNGKKPIGPVALGIEGSVCCPL